MIPKKIHYCWCGPHPMRPLHLECIESWKRFAPDYALVRWDETNIPTDAAPFIRETARLNQWGFGSDFVRLHALYHEGGIYMDVDMLLVKPLDDLLQFRGFCGFEDEARVGSAILGSVERHPFIEQLYHRYKVDYFDVRKRVTMPNNMTRLLREYGLKNESRQRVREMEVFPSGYFFPFPLADRERSYEDFVRPETYAVHLWDHSWRESNKPNALQKFRAEVRRFAWRLWVKYWKKL